MKFFQKLERKFGRYAIHNLMYYIIVLYLIGLGIVYLVPERTDLEDFYFHYLSAYDELIFCGFRISSVLFPGKISGTGLGRLPL